MPEQPCPTCSGPSRETVRMACPTCGTDYGAGPLLYAPLRGNADLHVCLICGAVVPAKGIDMHEQWHQAIADSAIQAHARIDRIVGG